jgi:glycerol-1-phosphate dehydrogenase [NAD(P)+]
MSGSTQDRIDAVLQRARDTRELQLGAGALASLPTVFARHFPGKQAVVVADRNTMRVAGNVVAETLSAGAKPFVFEDPDLYAEHRFVERLQSSLASHDAIPLSVGSGTINDITKLAAHRTGRQYLCVATAASMDGYTAYGSSITYRGSKQTFDCPAPVAVVADVDVIRAAPPELTAAGYADLLAKLTAGADWIVADALGEELINPLAWSTVQGDLKRALADPSGCRAGDADAIERLTEGLMMGGFAMQATMTSRPASGAEHQFSHLWDMQHHEHNGQPVSHGFKVAVATVAVARLYEALFEQFIDVRRGVAAWRAWDDVEADIRRLFPDIPELRDKALEETRAKHTSRQAVQTLLDALDRGLLGLRESLRKQLPSSAKLIQMLKAVGAPTEPEEIGIPRQRLRDSYRLAYHIRRRFTILDVAVLSGLLDTCLAKMFPELA